MLGRRYVRFASRSGAPPAGTIAVLALWCLLSFVGGATKALCLDLGGSCSPSAGTGTAPCHDEAPDGGFSPSCSSCVDVLVPEESSARCGRPDHELRAQAAAPAFVVAGNLVLNEAVASTAPLTNGSVPPHPGLRSTVLLI